MFKELLLQNHYVYVLRNLRALINTPAPINTRATYLHGSADYKLRQRCNN